MKGKRKLRNFIIIYETLLKIGSELIWLAWVAIIELKSKEIFGISIYI